MSTPTERPRQSEMLRQAQRYIEDAEDRHGVKDSETLRNYYYIVARVMLDTLQTKGVLNYGQTTYFSNVAFDLQQGISNPFVMINEYTEIPEIRSYLVGQLLEWATKRFVDQFHADAMVAGV